MTPTTTAVFVGLAALTTILGFGFVILRYIIRAETSELRKNSGSTVKDKVDLVVELAQEARASAKTAAESAKKSAQVASETKDALDEHVRQSAALMADGDRREKRIWDALDSRRALDHLTEALPIVARSTPHEEEHTHEPH